MSTAATCVCVPALDPSCLISDLMKSSRPIGLSQKRKWLLRVTLLHFNCSVYLVAFSADLSGMYHSKQGFHCWVFILLVVRKGKCQKPS